MSLAVWTARVSYGGPDRLDISRKSAGPDGLPFAPSWTILAPVLDARKRWKAERTPFVDRVIEEGDLWDEYVARYLAEMRASYRAHRAAWDALLARREVTLCCYCADPYHCHRLVLSVAVLAKLGGVYRGDR